MRRSIVLLAALSASVMAGAQSGRPLTPGQRHDHFKRNHVLVEQLVIKTVSAAAIPNDALARADGYYTLLVSFNREINSARSAKETARTSELSKHLTSLLDRGLAPTLEQARIQVDQGTHVENFKTIKDQLLSQLDALLVSMSEDDQVRKSLQGARQRLEVMADPKR